MGKLETILTPEHIKKYAFAGNAVILVESTRTGNKFGYRIMQSNNGEVFFVHVVSKKQKGTYLGLIVAKTGQFQLTSKSKANFVPENLEVIAFKYVLPYILIDKIPNSVIVTHLGRCGRCGKKLQSNDSLDIGIGKNCLEKLG